MPPKRPSQRELTAIADLRSALRRFLTATDDVTRRHGLTARRYDLLAILHGNADRLFARDAQEDA